MCGIVGILREGGLLNSDETQLTRMHQAVSHRGPDDFGCWIDRDAGVAMGHRRLSIVDLSPAGHQPMIAPSGRFVISFNGEIYNHLEIRTRLPHIRWRGHSDTETLAAAIDDWGLPRALRECVGMFALAVWDVGRRTLSLARDRVGEKPLYYGWQENVFLFGSELKALRTHTDFGSTIDADAAQLMLSRGYIAAPYTIYKGINKLDPGMILHVGPNRSMKKETYWALEETIERAKAQPFVGTEAEAIQALDVLLRSVVGQQMLADVPLGAFLSGGIDSSTVVALMQAQSSRPIQTFTIGFEEARYDEASYAGKVAQHIGTDHTSLYVTSSDALNVIPHLPTMFDEPFGDSSAIPTYLVSKLARAKVTVSLSGDGADELFSGYNRYLSAQRLLGRIASIPIAFREVLGGIISSVPQNVISNICGLTDRSGQSPAGYRAHRLAALGQLQEPGEFYNVLTDQWFRSRAANVRLQERFPGNGSSMNDALDCIEVFMTQDSRCYLPDDILCKVDRSSMAVSLESRAPFLDHRVVAFAWSLPGSLKLRDGRGKHILRQLLSRYVPENLTNRPKMGFAVPIDDWLRGPLRSWAEELLAPSEMQHGLLPTEEVRKRWLEHLSGRYNWRDSLWNALMFQAWFVARRN